MPEWFFEMTMLTRTLSILAVATGAHLGVYLIRIGSGWLTHSEATASVRKLRTVVSLATSTGVFVLYFLALGFILRELGVNLAAYLATASVIGLAVGFGSQGVVQDVVTGLTLIFSNVIDVGEMVSIGGQTGIVRTIGMRFVTLENSFGALVSIPNRTITNVVSFPRGYVRLLVDVSLTGDDAAKEKMVSTVENLLPTVEEQFPGITRVPPSIEGRFRTTAGRDFLRVKFRIWPERGEPISESFRQELLYALTQLDADYPDWMVAVYFEVEKPAPRMRRRPFRRR